MIKLPQRPDSGFSNMDGRAVKIGNEGDQIKIGDLFKGS